MIWQDHDFLLKQRVSGSLHLGGLDVFALEIPLQDREKDLAPFSLMLTPEFHETAQWRCMLWFRTVFIYYRYTLTHVFMYMLKTWDMFDTVRIMPFFRVSRQRRRNMDAEWRLRSCNYAAEGKSNAEAEMVMSSAEVTIEVSKSRLPLVCEATRFGYRELVNPSWSQTFSATTRPWQNSRKWSFGMLAETFRF